VTGRSITGLLATAAVAASLTACLPSPSPGTGSAGQPGAGSSAPVRSEQKMALEWPGNP